VIHVRVREQYQVGRRQFRKRHRGLDQPLDSQRDGSEIEADASTKYRIGNDGKPIDPDDNRTMPDPGRMQSSLRPRAEPRFPGHTLDRTPHILRNAPPKFGRGAICEHRQPAESEPASN
jgi:hypothetical protein